MILHSAYFELHIYLGLSYYGVVNTVELNSSIVFLIQVCYWPSEKLLQQNPAVFTAGAS